MGSVVLDTSVLLGSLDPEDAHHQSAADALAAAIAAGDELVVPATVLAEALVSAARQGADVRDRVRDEVVAAVHSIHSIDREVATHAADIRAVHPAIKLPDALVMAVARAIDGQVLTADKRWTSVDQRVLTLV